MKFLRYAGIFVLIIIVFAIIFVKVLPKRSVPGYDGELTMPGLQDEVVVYYDSLIIPHIYAKNETDLYKTVGYMMAQERLWQMDLLRRVTLGRLSEIFGSEYVKTDLLLRSLRNSKKSFQILDSLDSNMKQSLQAFADGVNYYISKNKKRLPVEFTILGYTPDPWEPQHSLNLIGYMAWDLKAGWSQFIMQKFKTTLDSALFYDLMPDIEERKSVIAPNYLVDPVAFPENLLSYDDNLEKLGAGIFDASNNWAVNAKKSALGKPILANDMHLGYTLPGIWMQMHQVIEGELNVTGVTLPGQPLIVSGHNESIAWGMTNTYVDNVDFYEEKVNKDTTQYFFNGKWIDIESMEEKIATKGGDTIILTNRFTHRGPIVSEHKNINGKIISMHWAGEGYSNEIKTVYLLNRAKNWDDFKNAVKNFRAISQNINYADVDGNIGIYACAGIPIRKREFAKFLFSGDTSEYDWKGYVPFEEQPFEFNPKTNYVASANNKTVGNEYPYHIGTWYTLPYRYKRIVELLESKEKLSVEDFKKIQTDNYSKLAEEMMPNILSALEKNKKEINDLENKALQILNDWNFTYEVSSRGALIFETLYLKLIRNIFQDEIKDDFEEFLKVSKLPRVGIYNIWNKPSGWWDNKNTPGIREGRDDIIVASFKETIRDISDKSGSGIENWSWGGAHRITLEHPLGSVKLLDRLFNLNRGAFDISGSFHTVAPYKYDFTEPFDVTHGASQRHIYVVGDWDKSITVIPTGNSGIPGSKYYGNQAGMYLTNQYHHDWFSFKKVEGNAMYKSVLRH